MNGLANILVRNISDETHIFLKNRASEMVVDGKPVSVNQLIGIILNNECKKHLLREEVTELTRLNNNFENLLDAIIDQNETYSELIDHLK